MLSRRFLPSAISRATRAGQFAVRPGGRCASTLTMFPEYAQAKKNFDEGQFQRAVPDFQRIFEVVQSLNTPQCNPMLLEVTNQLVHSYLYQGQAAKALGVLQTASQLASVTSKEHVVLHLLKSKTHMWSGNFAQSLQSAQKATNTLEALDQEGDIKLFADVYGQLGISHLLLGDFDDAEGYLQMAARWAQTPIQQLRSATNYGSAQLFRAASETSFSLWQRHLRMIEATPSAFFQEFISSSTAKVDAKKIAELNTNISSTVTVVQQQASSTSPTPTVQDMAPEAKKLIQFALDIWQESVQELINAHSGATDGNASAAAAAAAAMCGPMSSSSATIGMTGLVGDDVRTVPSSSSSPTGETTTTTTSTTTPHLSLDEALRQDVDLALAYGHLLTNIAEAQDALHPQSSDASHTLSTALTVLTPLSHLPVTQPVLARVLKWIAFHHSRASQNVSAEGLYRSALDKMTAATGTTTTTTTGHNSMMAYAQHDARCQYETVATRGLYAQVLQHWERREAQGASLQQDVVTQQLPRVVVSDTRRPLIPSQLVYPC